MKVKALKNLILFNGVQIHLNEIKDLEDKIAKDLIRGKYVIEFIEEVKKSKETEKPKRTKKPKVGDK